MRLTDTSAKIDSIYLDPFNPRFIEQQNISQDEIKAKILSTRDAKELLNSLKINIKWVNKIVVIKKTDFTDEQNNIKEINKAEYLVVEGNNRLACLKSGKIDNLDSNTMIPVIIAEKEDGETEEEFAAQIRVTQGISNVMVVKEWSVISKARHLFNMYQDIKAKPENNDKSPHEIYKQISAELGIGSTEVRQSSIRYEFYNKINEISDKIPEGQWGYLEAFDRTAKIRKKFGMLEKTNLIDLDSDDDDSDYIQEILQEIPVVIAKAHSEGINTKQFRDIVNKELLEINNSEDLLEYMQNISQKDSEYKFKNQLVKSNQLTEEDKWTNTFDEIYKKLELFPIMTHWADNHKHDLEKIHKKTEQYLKLLKSND